ncbi:MAG: hypothetical protein ACXAAM_03905 [Candidatus Heimdallarchaeaceae archaeon]|jgi:hypothetical protein
MNKRGLILVFLFVIASIGVIAPTYAAENSSKTVNIQYGGPHLEDKGEVYVDLVFVQDYDANLDSHDLSFFFYYDLAMTIWAAPEFYGYTVGSYGAGEPQVYWWYDTPNNQTLYPTLPMYNETRFGGYLNVMLDDYSLGISNYDPGVSEPDTWQDIPLTLDTGWHYLTVIAAEMVSDRDHTEFEWQYAKDQIKFYIGLEGDAPVAAVGPAMYNTVNLIATATPSMDMGQAFNYSAYDEIRILVEPVTGTQSVALGTENKPIAIDLEFNYNSSSGEADFIDTAWAGPALEFNGGHTGESNISWVVNDGPIMFGDEATLYTGINYVYGLVWGLQPDSGSVYFWQLGIIPEGPIPNVGVDIAIFTISVGLEEAGFGFGIFISVSILGLVTALFVMRRRK